MRSITNHFTRCFIAGIVALLPIAGTLLTVTYLEASLAGTWLAQQQFYFPGMGLILAAVTIYLVGLVVSTLVGRWCWSRVDRLLNRIPALGRLYLTVKQILGYGDGKDGIFQRVVLVPMHDTGGVEVGLVTTEDPEIGGQGKCWVFVPSAPTPTTGRLLLIETRLLIPLSLPPSEALKALVSIGKLPLESVSASSQSEPMQSP